MVEDIFQVLTSHPALISSLTSHPALISSNISQLRLIIISQEINSLAYNNQGYCMIRVIKANHNELPVNLIPIRPKSSDRNTKI